MKIFLNILLSLFLSVTSLAQKGNNSINNADGMDSPKMLAKAERKYLKDEKNREKSFFKCCYSQKTYRRYSGAILSDTVHHSTFVQFDSIRVYLFEHTDTFKSIFTSGLLSAQMIYCAIDSSCRAIPEISAFDTTGKPYIFNLWGWTGYTITIDYFHLLNDVDSKPTQRRFKFWVYPYKARMNGCNDILFLELTNEKANNKTDIETFIKGSHVTFLKYAWTMI